MTYRRAFFAADVSKAKRAEDMPSEQDALNVMWGAFQRLRELGWREAMYCPKDGSSFLVIEAGSTGTFECHYDGKWPTGTWWIYDSGDQWPSRPILFKPKPSTGEANMNETVSSTSDQRTVNNSPDAMRHSYRVLSDDEKATMKALKDKGQELLDLIAAAGNSRELSIARTKTEEAVMWAVKHVTA